ncbi:stress responsive protein [Thalassospira sp. HJ]|uniref:Dabb family protein n=1 Tax=Thalassospira sp. HJ TaxID=1616823 RepID=UPI0005CE5C93|nr:Dabb family protein [Thalassospira sp. HJ]KJE33590.1 stress responsive protein [Thalassospira sp. HJ]
MIRHIVLLQIPSYTDPAEVETMIRQLEQAALAVPGALAFCGGAKLPGSGLSQGFTHAVNIDFVDEAARDTYLAELDRDRVGGRLSEMTEGGLGGILIMNINIDNISAPQKGTVKKPQLRWE